MSAPGLLAIARDRFVAEIDDSTLEVTNLYISLDHYRNFWHIKIYRRKSDFSRS